MKVGTNRFDLHTNSIISLDNKSGSIDDIRKRLIVLIYQVQQVNQLIFPLFHSKVTNITPVKTTSFTLNWQFLLLLLWFLYIGTSTFTSCQWYGTKEQNSYIHLEL